MSRRYIQIIVTDEKGRAQSTVKGDDVTDLMLQVVKEATYTLQTNERFPMAEVPKHLGGTKK